MTKQILFILALVAFTSYATKRLYARDYREGFECGAFWESGLTHTCLSQGADDLDACVEGYYGAGQDELDAVNQGLERPGESNIHDIEKLCRVADIE